LHPQLKRKVRAAMEQILDDPHIGQALKDELEGLRSDRIGKFRIIYRVGKSRTIDVVAIGPRGKIMAKR
jgi:mRNA interferase RelE/StbE